MNRRLVWNFEFAPTVTPLPSTCFMEQKSEGQKWEIRFFWPDDETVILNTLDNSLLDLANYQLKHREDYYYLLPDGNHNIKRRRDELLYKPLLKKEKQAMGFGAKININTLEAHTPSTSPVDAQLEELAERVMKNGVEVYVKKEAFIYKFPTKPKVKLELARLEVHNKIYLSACIEGKSLNLVETIAEHLLGKRISCDYVTFLKNSSPL